MFTKVVYFYNSGKDTLIEILPDSSECIYYYEKIGTPEDLEPLEFNSIIPKIKLFKQDLNNFIYVPTNKTNWVYSENAQKNFFFGKVGDSYYTSTITDTLK